MSIRILLALIGALHLANGVYMLAAPQSWYAVIPGVIATGPMNPHFIADIGLAFIASGVGQLLGASAVRGAPTFAVAGSTWPALHALLHIVSWFTHGFPRQPDVIASELIGVAGMAALGVVLAWLRSRDSTTHLATGAAG